MASINQSREETKSAEAQDSICWFLATSSLWKYIPPVEMVMFAILVGLGILFIRHPFIDDKGAAATLVGALWGAAAILLGNGLNRHYEQAEEKEELQEKQNNLRALLMTEIVRIMINHMESTRLFVTAHQISTGISPQIECLSHVPADAVIFDSLVREIICLPKREIDALATFYGNLEMTRKLLRETAANGGAEVLAASRIAGAMQHDCAVAAEVVTFLAPQRKIQTTNGTPELLIDLLRKAAT
ncbi:MAG: hypothetical protein KGI37_10820 [Alphaproteobacteria bacterium]|nr:hypothetical protein [Alphaproteobacteria bacterium]